MFVRKVESSGSIEEESLSEVQTFLWLVSVYFDTFRGHPGMDQSRARLRRASALRLLGRWLDICSLDMTRLH